MSLKKNGIFLAAACLLGLAACAPMQKSAPEAEKKRYRVGAGGGPVKEYSIRELEALGSRSMTSAYFDRAMQYQETRFTAIPFVSLLKQFPAAGADAVLLDCFDDYQGILSMDDIRQYDLHLATRIHLAPGVTPPGWLNPLLVLVPDGIDAPFQERFMTANIREVRLVQRAGYYAPLEMLAGKDPAARSGLQVFKDNCVFCHRIQGVGGNKGGSLPARFDFKSGKGREGFQAAFWAFHRADNPDKQNIGQFVKPEDLRNLAAFMAGGM